MQNIIFGLTSIKINQRRRRRVCCRELSLPTVPPSTAFPSQLRRDEAKWSIFLSTLSLSAELIEKFVATSNFSQVHNSKGPLSSSLYQYTLPPRPHLTSLAILVRIFAILSRSNYDLKFFFFFCQTNYDFQLFSNTYLPNEHRLDLVFFFSFLAVVFKDRRGIVV